jgi:CheY-like chemotaxis protein
MPNQMRSILIADDNEVNTFVLKQVLTRQGIEVSVAEDGERAVEMAISNDFDLVLMDLNMPILDGTDATIQILAQKPSYKIVAMTALTDEEAAEAIQGIGMKGYVTKPFDPDQLTNKLVELLND